MKNYLREVFYLITVIMNRSFRMFVLRICLLSIMVVVVINFSLFVFFSKTSGPISTKLGKKHS